MLIISAIDNEKNRWMRNAKKKKKKKEEEEIKRIIWVK